MEYNICPHAYLCYLEVDPIKYIASYQLNISYIAKYYCQIIIQIIDHDFFYHTCSFPDYWKYSNTFSCGYVVFDRFF